MPILALAAWRGSLAFHSECPSTLEDLYGETGNSFQAAMGFVSFEGTSSDPATQSYGMGLDDMYVEWRELARGPDTTSCVTGQCAALEVTQANLFDSEAVVAISLLDSTPYGAACIGGNRAGEVCYPSGSPFGFDCGEGLCGPTANDCDLDGLYDGDNDDDDCDDDGVQDVVAHATSGGGCRRRDRGGSTSPPPRETSIEAK